MHPVVHSVTLTSALMCFLQQLLAAVLLSSITCRIADNFLVIAVQVVNGLTSLLSSGSSPNSNLSSLESYNTALTFVQALARTQDSNGNTTAVSISNPAVSATRACNVLGKC